MTITPETYSLQAIGFIRSAIRTRRDAPCQGAEGAPNVWLDLLPSFAPGLLRISPGAEVIVITWLHQAHRDVLQVHPRRNPDNPLTGVFFTRSPDRPNPLGCIV
jgi:tRNA-Thr(GGU) m(6)t(6)A37 methyltransferase TsaA